MEQQIDFFVEDHLQANQTADKDALDEYLFYDTLHPTEAGHALVSDLAFGYIKSPSPLFNLNHPTMMQRLLYNSESYSLRPHA